MQAHKCRHDGIAAAALRQLAVTDQRLHQRIHSVGATAVCAKVRGVFNAS